MEVDVSGLMWDATGTLRDIEIEVERWCGVGSSSATLFFYDKNNHSNGNLMRRNVTIFNGKAIPSGAIYTDVSNYNNYSYCLKPGETLYYKPELQVYFPFMSVAIFLIVFSFLYKTIIKPLLP